MRSIELRTKAYCDFFKATSRINAIRSTMNTGKKVLITSSLEDLTHPTIEKHISPIITILITDHTLSTLCFLHNVNQVMRTAPTTICNILIPDWTTT